MVTKHATKPRWLRGHDDHETRNHDGFASRWPRTRCHARIPTSATTNNVTEDFPIAEPSWLSIRNDDERNHDGFAGTMTTKTRHPRRLRFTMATNPLSRTDSDVRYHEQRNRGLPDRGAFVAKH